MANYDPELTLSQAVKQYFVANKFGDNGGYNDRWVEVKLGPIPFYVLNTQERVRAVRFHDLHHILTQTGAYVADVEKVSQEKGKSWKRRPTALF